MRNINLTWWNGSEQVNNYFETNATNQDIKEAIGKVSKMEDYNVDDFLDELKNNGFKIKSLEFEEYEFWGVKNEKRRSKRG